MKKLFKWLMLLLFALAVVLVVVLYNPGLVRGPLERYLGGVAGHAVSLDGELEINTGRQLEIAAKDIRISGPEWASRDSLVEVGSMDLKLNTMSLFRDIVIIESLSVDKLLVNLETNAAGTRNWISARQTASPRDSKDTKAGDHTIFVFNDVQVRDSTIRFKNGKKGLDNVFNIITLSHHQQADGMLLTTLNGELNKRPVNYTHTVGPYRNLLDGRDISYSANGHLGELAISGDALIDNLREPRQPKFDFDLQGPDIDEITAMLGVEDLGGGGFALHASGGEIDGIYKAGVSGQVGDVSLSIAAQASDITRLNDLDLTTEFNGPSLDRFTSVFGFENWPDRPFSLKGEVKRLGGTLEISNLALEIGHTELLLDARLNNYPGLDNSRARLSVSGDDISQFRELLHLPDSVSGPFSLMGTLEASVNGQELLDIDFDNPFGQLKLSGTLGPSPDYIGSKFELRLDGQNANAVMSIFGHDILPQQPYDLVAHIGVVKNGLQLERGAQLTIQDEQLNASGFIGLGSGAKDTDLEIRIKGKHLARLLGRLNAFVKPPDRPYELSGRMVVTNEGLNLENVDLGLDANHLKVDGLIALNGQLSGTALDFHVSGDDLTSLNDFPMILDTLDMLVPGQSYRASGRFLVDKSGWKLDAIEGQVGKTEINLDTYISRLDDFRGSSMRFRLSGPDVHGFLTKKIGPDLPAGQFESSGQVILSGQTLGINGFSFKTADTRIEAGIELGWPLGANGDASFNVKIHGDDIRSFLPATPRFAAEKAAFDVTAAGNKRGDLLNIDEFHAESAYLKASLKGKTVVSDEEDKAEFDIDVVSEDISRLGKLNGQPLPALPMKVSAGLIGNLKKLDSQNLEVSLGNSTLNGELGVSLKGPTPALTLTATSDYVDLRPFLQKSGSGYATPPTTQQSDGSGYASKSTAGQNRLIPPKPVPLDTIAAIDLKINLKIAELRTAEDDLRGLYLDAVQTSGSLDVRQISYESPRGKLRASLSIVPEGNGKAYVEADLNTEDFILNSIDLPDEKLDQVPRFDISFHGGGRGAGLREVAGTLNGSLYVGSTGGDAENLDLGALEIFVLDKVLKLIMPKSQDKPDTHFSCIATVMEISDGVVKTTPALALTSERLAMVIKGTLDLKTEKMNFNFNATPTNALKINAGEVFQPYILIGGTLAEPEVGVDPSKAVILGGAAVATAGLTVLAKGVVDRVGNVDPVCEKMLESAPPDHVR